MLCPLKDSDSFRVSTPRSSLVRFPRPRVEERAALPLDYPWSRTDRPTDPGSSIAGARGKYATHYSLCGACARVGGAVEGENKPQLNPAAGDAHSRRCGHRQTHGVTLLDMNIDTMDRIWTFIVSYS